jgi:hypothetical protein
MRKRLLIIIKNPKIEWTCFTKSPLPPLFQRGVFSLPLVKGGEEGFYKTKSLLLYEC